MYVYMESIVADFLYSGLGAPRGYQFLGNVVAVKRKADLFRTR